MSAVLTTPKTTSGGEIITHLINATDGEGLHFDGAVGNIDIATPPDLGTAFSFEFIIQADSWDSSDYIIDFGTGGRLLFYSEAGTSFNLALYDSGGGHSFGVKVLDDLKVHHLVVTIDGTAAILYDNGNQVGTTTLAGASDIDSCTDAAIGTRFNAASGFFNGTIYRARLWNKTLSQAEVTASYENATVPFIDQYGSQTSKILNGTAWTGATGATPPTSWTNAGGTLLIDGSSGSGDEPALKITRSSSNPYIYQTFASIVGKKYRVQYRVKNGDATSIEIGLGSSGVGSQYGKTIHTSTDWTSYETEITATTTVFSVYFQVMTSTGTEYAYVDSVTIEQIGAVADYDLAFAQPEISLTVQDRAGAADGTSSATGVIQVTPIEQLNTAKLYTGTEELTAKIKSVTSATTVGAVFIYDTSADSDSGKWRKKCKGLSWFDEAASATRSARSEFPAMALIVADNTSASTVTIYDLDDPAMPLWMQFTQVNSYPSVVMLGRDTPDITSVTMLNGRLWVGLDNTGYAEAMAFINFTADNGTMFLDTSWDFGQNIANRNTATDFIRPSAWGNLVNNAVNDVAATVLEGAEIGALGLPIPTVAVATDGGVSVIHPSGDVYDDTYQVTTSKEAGSVGFNSTGGYWYKSRRYSGNSYYYFINRPQMIFADTSSATGADMFRSGASGYGTPLLSLLGGGNFYLDSAAQAGDDYALGQTGGLSLIKNNTGNPAEGAVCDITSAYNTGYMVGDIRGAWFAASDDADRSVKNNALTKTGTITATAVATGAEQYGFSGFSASNYLSLAHTTDLDLAGDFSVMVWLKFSITSAYDNPFGWQYYTSGAYSGNGWRCETGGSNSVLLKLASGSSLSPLIPGVSSLDWNFYVFTRRGSSVYAYRNGSDEGLAPITNSTDFTNSNASFRVGLMQDGSAVGDNSSISLLRISATAPTPQQIKEIYEAEKPLFQANAKCLLQSTSGSPNNVHDLSYDKSTDLLSVSQYVLTDNAEGMQRFRGLEMVDMLDGSVAGGWSTGYTTKIATAGGVTAGYHNGTPGGVVLDLPALDVRAELNEGEDKLPDDGKFHFEGVTLNATPTIIGQIPMAANERMIVRAKVEATEYQNFAADSEWFHGEVRRQYRCDMSGARDQDAAVDYKYTDSYTSTMDISWEHASTNTAVLKVTGVAATTPETRIVWKASVEVQRISEKTYER